MKIDTLISKLKSRTAIDVDRKDSEGRALITFETSYTWSDGIEKILAIWVEYNINTGHISKLRLYGYELQQILGYTYIHHTYLWCKIDGYNPAGLESNPPYITIFPKEEEDITEISHIDKYSMTIDSLMRQFNYGDYEIVRNDIPGKILVQFKTPYFYMDCDEGIIQFLAVFNPVTKVIKSIKFYGMNMRTMLKYVQQHDSFFWCPIIHYIHDVYCSTPSITIITSL